MLTRVRKRKITDHPEGLADAAPHLNMDRPLSVGATLRARRIEQGIDLAAVADATRIRRVYLEAIEEGEFSGLPGGQAYAIGFLRTYAGYLGFDEQAIVRRFKDELAGDVKRPAYRLPKPMPEGRAPTGAILLMATLLGGLGYGGWYYLSATEQTLAEAVAPLPARLQTLIEGWGTTPAGVDVATAVASQPLPPAPIAPGMPSPAVGPVPASTADVQLPPIVVGPLTPRTTASGTPAIPAASGTQTAPALPTAPIPTPRPAEPQAADGDGEGEVAPVAVELIGNGGTAQPASGVLPVPAPASQTQAAATQTTQPAPIAPPQPGEAPTRIFGAVDGPSRIQIRATADSWFQVRDGRGELLFTRVMRPGDVYRVPDQVGLRMVTGNAGGLAIAIDGTPVPPLGTQGQVLRDVPLDPARLAPRPATN
ncbi:MAG TPA: RodZ domain-containing protein [Azospirillaceae bacterium]|nr:RodZ domain-containing protein [Azospirillaceae bacterium]